MKGYALLFALSLQSKVFAVLLPSSVKIAFIPILQDSQSLNAIQSAILQVNSDSSLLPTTTLMLSSTNYSSDRVLEYAANLTAENNLALFLDGYPTPSHELVSAILKIPLITTHPRRETDVKANVISLAASRNDINQAMRDIMVHFQWTSVLVLFDVRWREQASQFLSSLPYGVSREAIEMILDQEGKLFDETKKKLRHQNNKLVEVIVLFCDARFVTIVMEQVHCSCSRGAERAHNWILADMLPSFDMVAEASQIVIGFTPHVVNDVHSRRLVTDLSAGIKDIKNHSYILYDSVLTFAHALNKITTSGQWVSQINSINVEESKNGMNILNEMKKVNTFGATGSINFNYPEGTRKSMTLDIWNLRSNKFVKVGNWSLSGLMITDKAEQNKKSDEIVLLSKLNRKLKVVVILDPPFTFSTKDEKTGQDIFEGYSIDLLSALSKQLNFNYQIYKVPDNKYGSKQSDGTYSGIVGELINRKADFSTAPLTITSDRLQHLTFSKPYMQFTMDLISKKPTQEGTDILAFMMPYSIPVWLMALACIAFMTFMLTVINHFSPFSHKHGDNDGTGEEFNVFNSFWFSLASMLCQGGDNTPKSLSGRVLVGCYWFCVLIWVSTYTANLAAFFSYRHTSRTIKNLQYVLENGYNLHIVSNTALEETFKNSKYPLYEKLYHRMVAEKTLVNNFEEGFAKVRQNKKSVFMDEFPYTRYIVEQKPCDLLSVKGFMGVRGYGIAMTKCFPYANNLTVALLKLQETGVLEELERKWWDYRSQCHDEHEGGSATTERLGLANMAGVYLVIAAGCVIGIMSVLFELIWSKKGEKIKNAISCCRSNKPSTPTRVKPFEALN